MKYIKITTSDDLELRDAGNGNFIETLKKAIDAQHIEPIFPKGLNRPYAMIADEEGLFKVLPINRAGTLIYSTGMYAGGTFSLFGSPIVGDIAICKIADTPNGEVLSPLEDDEAKTLLDHLNRKYYFLFYLEETDG